MPTVATIPILPKAEVRVTLERSNHPTIKDVPASFKVYVNVLGDAKEVWDDVNLQRMIVQGIPWALGELPLELPGNARNGPSAK